MYNYYSVETEVCFVVTLSRDVTEEAFALIKRTVCYLIHEYGYLSVNYCLVLRDENNSLGNINFEEVFVDKTALLKRVEVLSKSKSSPRLFDDLCAARDAFRGPKLRKEAKKVSQHFCGATCKKGFRCYCHLPHSLVLELFHSCSNTSQGLNPGGRRERVSVADPDIELREMGAVFFLGLPAFLPSAPPSFSLFSAFNPPTGKGEWRDWSAAAVQ